MHNRIKGTGVVRTRKPLTGVSGVKGGQEGQRRGRIGKGQSGSDRFSRDRPVSTGLSAAKGGHDRTLSAGNCPVGSASVDHTPDKSLQTNRTLSTARRWAYRGNSQQMATLHEKPGLQASRLARLLVDSQPFVHCLDSPRPIPSNSKISPSAISQSSPIDSPLPDPSSVARPALTRRSPPTRNSRRRSRIATHAPSAACALATGIAAAYAAVHCRVARLAVRSPAGPTRVRGLRRLPLIVCGVPDLAISWRLGVSQWRPGRG
jgi:hypothetical protein